MKMSQHDQTKAMLHYGIAFVVGLLAGLGAESLCIGLAAGIAMFVLMAKDG